LEVKRRSGNFGNTTAGIYQVCTVGNVVVVVVVVVIIVIGVVIIIVVVVVVVIIGVFRISVTIFK
jgi:hypothetical protein